MRPVRAADGVRSPGGEAQPRLPLAESVDERWRAALAAAPSTVTLSSMSEGLAAAYEAHVSRVYEGARRPAPGLDAVGRIAAEWEALRPAGGFELIMADPPWRFVLRSARGRGRSVERHYQTLDLDQIAALPVGALAARDCLLWLWSTSPMLPLQLRVAEAWGFRFATLGWWSKRSPVSGKQAFGTGYMLRSAGEPFILATRGRPRTSRVVRSTIEGPRREHSRKPDEAFAAAEALMPGAARIELFSRQARPGWIGWGDEFGRFEKDREGRA